MLKFLGSTGLFCILLTLQDVRAVRLQLSGRTRSSDFSQRETLSGFSGLNDSQSMAYSTNLTLNNKIFSMLIDTGSNDIYAAGTVPNAKDTGKTSRLVYAGIEVEGQVKTAELNFAGFCIADQAYLEIQPSHKNQKDTGLIGLGPSRGSNIHDAIGSAAGDTPLDRIFKQDRNTPNYITVLLGRSDDPDNRFPGDLTIGELLSGYENVTNQPKLEVSKGAHWQTLLDKNGIIGPDGKYIDLPKSQLADPKDGGSRLTVVFDTGFTFPQLPSSIIDAVYKNIKGAELRNISGKQMYTLPCDQEVKLAFVFGGQQYPIHPLDTNMNGALLGLTDTDGSEICFGAFQPTFFDPSFGSGNAPQFDIVLGMAFLRNTYLYVNFGDWIEGSPSTADPYVQLLSTTNDAEAHQEFVQVRIEGQNNSALKADLGKTSNKNKNKNKKKKPLSKVVLIIIIAVVVLVIIAGIALTVLFCCLKKRRKSAGAGASATYSTLEAPAPIASTELHAAPYSQFDYDTPSGQTSDHYNPQEASYNSYPPQASSYSPQPYASHQPYDAPPGPPPMPGTYQTPYDPKY